MRRGILATQRQLRSLRRRIARQPYQRMYESLQLRCGQILSAAPVGEVQWSIQWSRGIRGSALAAARTTQGRIFDLLIADSIESNSAYRNRAIEELSNLCSWSEWVDPCHKDQRVDQCTAESAVAAVVGLDWLWEHLPDSERQKTLNSIRTKALDPYRRGVAENAWWYTSYHSWNAVVNSGIGLAALAMRDEPPAGEVYEVARAGLRHFFDALGKEGGWDEGTGYWGYSLRYVLLLAEAARRFEDDNKLFHERGMDQTGLFPIYFSPNGQPAGFGDSPTVPLYGTMYLLAAHGGCREMIWWLDRYAFHQDVTVAGWSSLGLGLLFRPNVKPTDNPVKKLQPVKVFSDIGWAAMADRWPDPSLYVSFKTGDLSASHSQQDMNSLQLQVDREMILFDLGSPGLSKAMSSDDREKTYEARASSHNTLIVAGRDQSIDACGEIVANGCGDGYRYLLGDAGTACGEDARFFRHVVMLVDPADQAGLGVVVLDEIQLSSPQTVELFWHTPGMVELQDQTMSGTVVGQMSRLHFALSGSIRTELKLLTGPVPANHHTDMILHIKAGVVSRAQFVSVFSRTPLTDQPRLVAGEQGLLVSTGLADLHFAANHGRLGLKSVIHRTSEPPGAAGTKG